MVGGVVEPESSVNSLSPPEFSVQLCAPPAPPNFSAPMVREVSSVTVRSAESATVLKSAVLPAPSATMPLSHLVASLQLPLASAVQTPLLEVSEATRVLVTPLPGKLKTTVEPLVLQKI